MYFVIFLRSACGLLRFHGLCKRQALRRLPPVRDGLSGAHCAEAVGTFPALPLDSAAESKKTAAEFKDFAAEIPKSAALLGRSAAFPKVRGRESVPAGEFLEACGVVFRKIFVILSAVAVLPPGAAGISAVGWCRAMPDGGAVAVPIGMAGQGRNRSRNFSPVIKRICFQES